MILRNEFLKGRYGEMPENESKAILEYLETEAMVFPATEITVKDEQEIIFGLANHNSEEVQLNIDVQKTKCPEGKNQEVTFSFNENNFVLSAQDTKLITMNVNKLTPELATCQYLIMVKDLISNTVFRQKSFFVTTVE